MASFHRTASSGTCSASIAPSAPFLPPPFPTAASFPAPLFSVSLLLTSPPRSHPPSLSALDLSPPASSIEPRRSAGFAVGSTIDSTFLPHDELERAFLGTVQNAVAQRVWRRRAHEQQQVLGAHAPLLEKRLREGGFESRERSDDHFRGLAFQHVLHDRDARDELEIERLALCLGALLEDSLVQVGGDALDVVDRLRAPTMFKPTREGYELRNSTL